MPQAALHMQWSPRDTRVTREELRDYIARNYRSPFMDVLTVMMQCRPTPEAMFAWAMEHPDRWANAIAIFAKLSGYTEKVEVEHNHLHVHALSDAELLQRLSSLREQPLLEQLEPLPEVHVQNLNDQDE